MNHGILAPFVLQSCNLATLQDCTHSTYQGCKREENCYRMPTFTYQEIDFQISVKEGFYHYQQKVSPAYSVSETNLDWAAIVVHRLPGRFREDQWFVSEQTTGSSIEIPKTTSRDEAVQHAITKIQQMGRDSYEKALARTQTKKGKSWKPKR